MNPSSPLRVYISPCETGPDAWRHQAEILTAHLPTADRGVVSASSPEESDLIFITDLRDEDEYRKVRHHPLVRLYPEKTFAISDADSPPRWVRGVLTSLTRSPFNLGRFRSGSYFLYHPDFRNHYVEKWRAEGTPPHEKKYLFSFMGRRCIPLRETLLSLQFQRPDVYMQDSSHFNNFSHAAADKDLPKLRYAELLIASKFVLCPRGNGASSIRLFESMQLGICPVIISDEWVLPHGPDWSRCAIRIRERDLPRLESILTERESEWRELGAGARAAYDSFFDGERYLHYLTRAARDIQKTSPLPEKWVQRLVPALVILRKARRRLARQLARRAA
jgi:hypothetical protein